MMVTNNADPSVSFILEEISLCDKRCQKTRAQHVHMLVKHGVSFHSALYYSLMFECYVVSCGSFVVLCSVANDVIWFFVILYEVHLIPIKRLGCLDSVLILS